MSDNNTKTFYHDCGKGDRPRGTGWKNYYDNFDAIFGKKDKTCIKCPRDVEMRCQYCGLKQADGSVQNLVAVTTVEVTKADEG
jgi:hypothetical protein